MKPFPLDPSFDEPPEALLGRLANPEAAAENFPHLFGRLMPALVRSDPLADEVIAHFCDQAPHQLHAEILRACDGASDVAAPLRALVDACRETLQGVDKERLERAGKVFFRAGVLGGLTLGTRSLVYGYASPVGNKPLAFTGALENKAEKRLAETSRFVAAVCAKGGLRPPTNSEPAAEGFRLAVHVRLMHAKVRAMAWDDPRWDRGKWGLPINQHDMLATTLLFGVVFVDGLLHLGLSVSDEEADDYQYLWNQVGLLLGVEPSLLPSSAREARRMGEFVRETQGSPDNDSRALVNALLNAPRQRAETATERRMAEKRSEFAKKMCRSMLDRETAIGLGLGAASEDAFIRQVRQVMRVLEKMRMSVPSLDEIVRLAGARYWSWNSKGAGDKSGGFVAPAGLEGVPR